MPELSKLQIRAKVLTVISEIKSIQTYSEDILLRFISDFSEIEDKKALFDIFIKEYIKMNEKEYIFSSLLLKETVPNDYINTECMELLKSTNLSDELKYKLIQLIRITGKELDYNEIPQYFDNPEEVLDKETKRLLEAAVFNPESMLDFLDFTSAVSAHDRSLLLNSLKMDYSGDVLANIIYPILYSNFEDDFKLNVVNILSDSKSSIAIAPFKYLIETSENTEIVNACKTGLKKLKLSGAKSEIAEEYFKNIIKSTKPAEFFTTIPDGNGNQALLVSRCTPESKYLLSATVTNDISGVIDCFGFYNITQEELIKILAKFYQAEGKYKVTKEYIKSKTIDAINKNISLKRNFPYEFICWSPLLCDIKPLDISLKEYAEKNCKIQLVSRNDILQLLTKDYTLRWFITPEENKIIKEVVDTIYSTDNIEINKINSMLKDKVTTLFNQEFTELWLNRIYNLIYLLRMNAKLKDADLFYTMLKSEEYLLLFKEILLQRSVFNNFVTKKEHINDTKLAANIFRKRNSAENKLDSKKIDEIIEILNRSWLNG